MPWTKNDYPASMKNLPAEARNKAVEIANALLDEGKMKESILIPTAISRAKDWAANHHKKTENKGSSKSTDKKEHGEDRYVSPLDDGGWAIKKESSKGVEQKFQLKKEAVKEARKEAKDAKASLTIQGKDGKVQKRHSYNPNNTGNR